MYLQFMKMVEYLWKLYAFVHHTQLCKVDLPCKQASFTFKCDSFSPVLLDVNSKSSIIHKLNIRFFLVLHSLYQKDNSFSNIIIICCQKNSTQSSLVLFYLSARFYLKHIKISHILQCFSNSLSSYRWSYRTRRYIGKANF